MQTSAQNALEVGGRELEAGRKITVLVSDPQRKKERSDAKANDRELYVTNLAASVKEEDLQTLFSPFGQIKRIGFETNERGKCRGFSFVEYEAEDAARAALSLNNQELKGRRIAVVTAQSRGVSTQRKAFKRETSTGLGRRADAASRTIKATGLPPDTPEFAVQQLFEKHGTIRSVAIDDDAHTAEIEFEHVADVGKVQLLPPGSITLGDATISIVGASATAASFAPRAARGRGRGRAAFSKPRGGIGAQRPASAATANGSTSKGQDAFRAMLGK